MPCKVRSTLSTVAMYLVYGETYFLFISRTVCMIRQRKSKDRSELEEMILT